jgi:hypothetical protein
MKKHFCLTVLFLAFASGLGLAQTDSADNTPSLGDIARRQHHVKKVAEKLFSDEDLPPPSALPQSQSSPASAAKSDSAEKNAEKPDKSAKPDASAKKEDPKSDLKKKLDHYTTERDAWQQAAKRYEDLLANEKDEFRRQTYEDALSKNRHNAELYQEKIDEMKSAQGTTQQDQPADASASGGGHK